MHSGKVYMHILPVPLLVYYLNLNISLMHVEHGLWYTDFTSTFFTVKMPYGFVVHV
jgi:hypothetical protein